MAYHSSASSPAKTPQLRHLPGPDDGWQEALGCNNADLGMMNMKQSKGGKATRNEITTSRDHLQTTGLLTNAPMPAQGAKRTVTFRVEYELKAGPALSAAQAAIIRASGAIKQTMEHGDTGTTGIKPGSVHVEIGKG
jgi:hypothetical protein